MSDLNINYVLFTIGIGFLLAFLLWQFGKKMMQKREKKKIFGTEKIFVSNDLLLEIFQFCNFRTVGTNFCLTNRRWSQAGQWHWQNRPHRIPLLTLNIYEECHQWFGRKFYWKKNGYLRSWQQQNAIEEKIGDVLEKIPKNYEKIKNLRIEWPYDCNFGWVDKKMTNFITACLTHMRCCLISIEWNGVEPPSFNWTLFESLFLASIWCLNEIHIVRHDANEDDFAKSHALFLWLIKWLLMGKENENEKAAARKLYFLNIHPAHVDWYVDEAKKKFFETMETMEEMPTFDVVFLLEIGYRNNSFEKRKIKNSKTGQIFCTNYEQIDEDEFVLMRLCNSVEAANEPFELSEAGQLSSIHWNIRPTIRYIQMMAQKKKDEANKKKLIPSFVDIME